MDVVPKWIFFNADQMIIWHTCTNLKLVQTLETVLWACISQCKPPKLVSDLEWRVSSYYVEHQILENQILCCDVPHATFLFCGGENRLHHVHLVAVNQCIDAFFVLLECILGSIYAPEFPFWQTGILKSMPSRQQPSQPDTPPGPSPAPSNRG